MENIIPVNYRQVAVEMFKASYKKFNPIIISSKAGVFGVIKDKASWQEHAQAIPIYVEYPVAEEYLDALYHRFYK